MKHIAAVLLLAAAAFAADTSEAVMEAARGWTTAAAKQDAAGLQRYLADDLQYAHSGGQTQNKEQYIAAVMKGPPHYESLTFSGVQIRFYGGTAILTGYVDVRMPNRDPYRVRTLQVYVQNHGQWQMAAHQSTRMAGS